MWEESLFGDEVNSGSSLCYQGIQNSDSASACMALLRDYLYFLAFSLFLDGPFRLAISWSQKWSISFSDENLVYIIT